MKLKSWIDILVNQETKGKNVNTEPGNMDFSQECGLALVYPDETEEIITFTQIRDGLLVE